MGFKVGWDGLTFFLDQLLILQPLRQEFGEEFLGIDR